MVLEAQIPRSSLESLTVVGVGGGKLDRDTHAKFEETYQIPVLTAYGATEFGGVMGCGGAIASGMATASGAAASVHFLGRSKRNGS